MVLFGEFTLFHYVGIVFLGSVIGLVIGELLARFSNSFIEAIDSVSGWYGFTGILIGLIIAAMPGVYFILFKSTGVYLQYMLPEILLSAFDVVMIAFLVVGGIVIIRNVVKTYLAYKYGC